MKTLLPLILTLTLLVSFETSAVAQIAIGYPPPPGSYSEVRYTDP